MITQCLVLDSLSAVSNHGAGGIHYTWINDRKQWPEDVKSLIINMPVFFGDEKTRHSVMAEWSVSHKNKCDAQWQLSGTYEKPTLSPSLNWVGVWHGWLQDGELKEC